MCTPVKDLGTKLTAEGLQVTQQALHRQDNISTDANMTGILTSCLIPGKLKTI
jgi:hypothetical protein